jgi:hypothetical protein
MFINYTLYSTFKQYTGFILYHNVGSPEVLMQLCSKAVYLFLQPTVSCSRMSRLSTPEYFMEFFFNFMLCYERSCLKFFDRNIC